MSWDAERAVDWKTLVEHRHEFKEGDGSFRAMIAVLAEDACWTNPFMCDVLFWAAKHA